jgi:hypothetical protein
MELRAAQDEMGFEGAILANEVQLEKRYDAIKRVIADLSSDAVRVLNQTHDHDLSSGVGDSLKVIRRLEEQADFLSDIAQTYFIGPDRSDYRSLADIFGVPDIQTFLNAEIESLFLIHDDLDVERRSVDFESIYFDKLTKAVQGYADTLEAIFETEHPESAVQAETLDVPSQTAAPIEAEVRNGYVTIKRDAGEATGDKDDLSVYYDVLKTEARQTQEALQLSNCDPRFLVAFSNVVDSFGTRFAEFNPVRLGLQLELFEGLTDVSRDSLADIVAARLERFSGSCHVFVAQFRKWVTFKTSLAVFPSDLSRVSENGSKIADTISNEPTVFSDELRSELAKLQASTSDGKNAKLGFVRSVENILIACLTEIKGIISKLYTQTRDEIIEKSSKAVAYAALGFIVVNASAITIFADSAPWLSWLKRAVQFLESAIK